MILKIIKNFLIRIFYVFNIKITINKINNNLDWVMFDKNSWMPYLNKNNNFLFNSYNEGLIKSGSQKSNSFFKEIRHYSLLNIAMNILEKNNYENFAECGCWKGHSSYSISLILNKYNFNKKFYIFDSFEGGLPVKKSADYSPKRYKQSKNDALKQQKHFASDFKEVSNLFKNFEFIKIYEGWIPAVFNKINDVKFSFVHIDVDLYQPTLDSLKYFFPKLIKGGIIVCDDYNYSDFPGAKKAVDEFLKSNEYELFYEVPLGGCIIIR
ncbi:MAG: hypothetical protein CMI90_05890 [Pelagibacteraceae bacterium]|nr:hypothetical protein [Pelagibacteraceae bacterium]